MNAVDEFFKRAQEHDLCTRGAELWGKCKSKKSLVDLALSSFGVDFFCNSVVQGWGLRPEEIETEFRQFNNGKYTRTEGYTSQLYCLPNADTIRIASTLTLIISFNGTIYIPQCRIAEVYLCNSRVKITGQGKAKIYLYNSTIRDSDKSLFTIKKEVHYE